MPEYNAGTIGAIGFRRDNEIDEEHPVKIDELLAEYQIPVELCATFSFEGILVVRNGDAAIGLSRRVLTKQSWRSFTLAHEFAHYEMHSSGEGISTFSDDRTSLNMWNDARQESEANHFAAELLIPSAYVRKRIKNRVLDFEMIRGIAEHCGASIRATGIQAISATDECAAFVIVGPNGRIRWSRKSSEFDCFLLDTLPVPTAANEWWDYPADEILDAKRGLNMEAELSVMAFSDRPDSLGEIALIVCDRNGDLFEEE